MLNYYGVNLLINIRFALKAFVGTIVEAGDNLSFYFKQALNKFFMDKLFFGDQESFLRIIITAPLIYCLIIINIKIMGKRTTSQLNSFDWLVTVAMGSIVAAVVMQKDTPLINAAFAIIILMGLQFIITKLMFAFPIWKRLVRSEPRILLYKGEFILENMRKERIVKSEILAAAREKGFADMQDIYAVVMETDASLSVIKKKENSIESTLEDVVGIPESF